MLLYLLIPGHAQRGAEAAQWSGTPFDVFIFSGGAALPENGCRDDMWP
jgi:hypothetical protein